MCVLFFRCFLVLLHRSDREEVLRHGQVVRIQWAPQRPGRADVRGERPGPTADGDAFRHFCCGEKEKQAAVAVCVFCFFSSLLLFGCPELTFVLYINIQMLIICGFRVVGGLPSAAFWTRRGQRCLWVVWLGLDWFGSALLCVALRCERAQARTPMWTFDTLLLR